MKHHIFLSLFFTIRIVCLVVFSFISFLFSWFIPLLARVLFVPFVLCRIIRISLSPHCKMMMTKTMKERRKERKRERESFSPDKMSALFFLFDGRGPAAAQTPPTPSTTLLFKSASQVQTQPHSLLFIVDCNNISDQYAFLFCLSTLSTAARTSSQLMIIQKSLQPKKSQTPSASLFPSPFSSLPPS